MRRASRFITSSSASNLRNLATSALPKHSTTLIAHQNPERQSLTGGFLKWGSLGSVRASSFASGFSPLKPKPLDSIIDIQRVKDRSPEDIASAWDDVSFKFPCFYVSLDVKVYIFAVVWIWVLVYYTESLYLATLFDTGFVVDLSFGISKFPSFELCCCLVTVLFFRK